MQDFRQDTQFTQSTNKPQIVTHLNNSLIESLFSPIQLFNEGDNLSKAAHIMNIMPSFSPHDIILHTFLSILLLSILVLGFFHLSINSKKDKRRCQSHHLFSRRYSCSIILLSIRARRADRAKPEQHYVSIWSSFSFWYWVTGASLSHARKYPLFGRGCL